MFWSADSKSVAFDSYESLGMTWVGSSLAQPSSIRCSDTELSITSFETGAQRACWAAERGIQVVVFQKINGNIWDSFCRIFTNVTIKIVKRCQNLQEKGTLWQTFDTIWSNSVHVYNFGWTFFSKRWSNWVNLELGAVQKCGYPVDLEQVLQNGYSCASIGFDIAETEPFQVFYSGIIPGP